MRGRTFTLSGDIIESCKMIYRNLFAKTLIDEREKMLNFKLHESRK